MNLRDRWGGPTRPLPVFVALGVLQLVAVTLVVAGIIWQAPRIWTSALLLEVGALVTGLLASVKVWRVQRSLVVLNEQVDRIAELQPLKDFQEAVAQRESSRSGRSPLPLDDKRLAKLPLELEQIQVEAANLAAERDRIRSGYSEVFINMFRRSQSLLQRQLQIIGQLEEREQSSEHLNRFYQLDHLVTRMRRNNENVLVLSGTELVRKTESPVGVSEVLRAAISEIDHYQRVRILAAPAVRLSKTAAGDLIRIVAELLDNATSFSAPERQVTVQAELGRHGGLSIGVFDNGIGMSDLDIKTANEHMSRLGSAEIARTRRIGLLVVGRLAGRHGIRVELFGGDGVEGVSALVSVPSAILLDEDAVRATLPGDPTRGTSVGPRRLGAARGHRSHETVSMTTTLRRDDSTPGRAGVEPRRRRSSWHGQSAELRKRRQVAQSDAVVRAHSDVPDELPTRVPKRARREGGGGDAAAARSTSQWFKARRGGQSAPKQQDNPVRPSVDAPNWTSVADRGWQIVETVTSADQYTYTEQGLPQREKGAHLIPGSAGGPPGRQPEPKAIERDANHLQRRLSSYQQGVQKAKEQENRERRAANSGGWTVLEDGSGKRKSRGGKR